MKLKNIILIICSGSLSLATYTSNAAEIFSDSFEAGDMSTTNADGFSWGKNNKTSIVTQHPKDGPVALYNNKPIYKIHSATTPDGAIKNWVAKDGKNSLRFHYSAGESWAEQRFNLGKEQPEIWVSFWLRVPTNFKHNITGKDNNKLFAIYMDGYERMGQGTTSVWEFWPDKSGGSVIAQRYRNEANRYNSGHKNYTSFIKYPDDQGRWMQLVFHIKAETTNNANNGVMQLWRKWEGEKFIQLHDWNNLDLHTPTATPGFLHGYVMGWSNPTYLADTDWLMDNFNLSTTPFDFLVKPNPPNSITVTTK
ncbi:MAG TPA: hypothetical protein ENJ28_03660 [Gammaproteobacteria bacterium]|nr:hypothetical protein [Gammaproteobacteria bacterium]